MRTLITTLIAALALTAAAPAIAGPGCNSSACERRVLIKATHAKWRAVVEDYGVELLRSRMRCESGGHGGYSLVTTGNGYYFAHQFRPSSWALTGGRVRGGVPIGRWVARPSRLEQDYRAVRLDAEQDDPWPNCP